MLCYKACLWLFTMEYIAYAAHASKSPLSSTETDLFYSDEGSAYIVLAENSATRHANAVVILLCATISLLAQVWLLWGVSLAFLAAGSVQDWRTAEVNELFLLGELLPCIAIGCKGGHTPSVVIACVILILFDAFVGESAIFGGGDLFVCMSALSALGFCAFPIFMVISCCVGLAIKVGLWVTRKHQSNDRGITFLPALFVGMVTAMVLDNCFGDVYTITLPELLWAIGSLQ